MSHKVISLHHRELVGNLNTGEPIRLLGKHADKTILDEERNSPQLVAWEKANLVRIEKGEADSPKESKSAKTGKAPTENKNTEGQ